MKTVALLFALVAVAHAEMAPRPEEPLYHLFAPELIIKYAREIDLDKRQREAIVAEVQKLQSGLVPVHFANQRLTQEMTRMLDVPSVDETKALAQVDKLMDTERDMKRLHVGTLIRIRNILTDAQRQKLKQLRR
jgi:Spy/CpxP family protein refolding chaperone